MSALAIIPARGGSRGIPRKNIRNLCGKPLLAWTIEPALAASSVERVVVSTDDAEIAAVAHHSGAEVVTRPPELAGDRASSEAALLHVLDVLHKGEGYQPDAIAFMQCTSPLTMPEDIDGAVKRVMDDGYDSVVTMIPFHYFVWRETDHGQLEGVNHLATRRLLRQEREAEYLEVGAVYAMRTQGLLEHRFRFFGRIGRYLLPVSRAFEIDEPDDWARAEMLMHKSGKVRWSFERSRPFARVRAVVTDFDGVMTDNRVVVEQDGRESVVCHRGDGWGIELLRNARISVACISTEENPVVRARCQKLGIPYWQGQHDKVSVLKAFLDQHRIAAEDCVYVGNDTNDAACLEHAGLAVVPRDAVPEVRHLADWQTEAVGGAGVLRELASRILKERQA
jgi:YrbI family 3-deoxy-D-manno-octulosonate 8-phosphate phosphatase